MKDKNIEKNHYLYKKINCNNICSNVLFQLKYYLLRLIKSVAYCRLRHGKI